MNETYLFNAPGWPLYLGLLVWTADTVVLALKLRYRRMIAIVVAAGYFLLGCICSIASGVSLAAALVDVHLIEKSQGAAARDTTILILVCLNTALIGYRVWRRQVLAAASGIECGR